MRHGTSSTCGDTLPNTRGPILHTPLSSSRSSLHLCPSYGSTNPNTMWQDQRTKPGVPLDSCALQEISLPTPSALSGGSCKRHPSITEKRNPALRFLTHVETINLSTSLIHASWTLCSNIRGYTRIVFRVYPCNGQQSMYRSTISIGCARGDERTPKPCREQ